MTETIGEQLKKARLDRKLVLEQVSHQIHVRVHYLQALENDDRGALPSEVQGRGFLRLYAGFLSLPVQPLLNQWEGRSPDENVIPSLPLIRATTPLHSRPRKPPAPTRPNPTPNVPTEAAAFPRKSQPTPSQISPGQSPEVAVPTPTSESVGDAPPLFVQNSQNENPQSEIKTQPEPQPVQDLPKTNSDQILVEIGGVLRHQRESLSLKLSDIERYTHVRLHYLQALEDGNLAMLPSPVQGRGMLSNYASFLELDSEALLLRFAEALQSRRLERKPGPSESNGNQRKRATRASGVRRFLTPDLLIGVSAILILIFFAFWGAAQISAMRKQPFQPTPLNISALMLTSSPAALPNSSATPSPNEGNTIPSTPGGSGDPSALEVTATIPSKGDNPIQVYIVASQRAWMRVAEDEKITFEGRVSPGNVYTFSGAKKVEVLTGNAAALQVFYNQTDLGILGSTGQVASLLFTKTGVITPTAQFSPTPSSTPLASLTPIPSPTAPTPTVTLYVP